MDNNDSDLRHYLFIVDIATIIVSSFFLFKFESSYWLTKGSAVNQAAGFGDIFHDWAVVLFIAIPLISISQLGLSALISKKQPAFVLTTKIIALSTSLLFINWDKLMAELCQKQNWKACILVAVGSLLFALYMYSVKRGIETNFKEINKWYIPAIAVATGLGITVIY